MRLGKKEVGTVSLGIALALATVFTGSGVQAQTAPVVAQNTNPAPLPLDRGAAGLWQSLRALHTRASLIMFTAHPDDEDGGVLAYESRMAGADTTLFTLNRGEGGQNVMSADFWDRLGLVRTNELLAADRYYGVHQYWSRVADFGFSKTREEALQQWGYDRVLEDSVRVVRETRPLVVTSVFAGNVSDGHGQHQVAGLMAQEVYKAAADPKMFPEQIREGLRPWAPLKMYVRLPFARITDKGVYDYATGNWAPARFRNYITNTWIEGEPSATVSIPEGQYDPATGLSAIQIGRSGLNEQKSQNGGIEIPAAGPRSSAYHLYASRVPARQKETGFFDGIDISLMGIADEAPQDQQAWIRARLSIINDQVEQAMRQFRVDAPEAIAPLLAQGLLSTQALMRQIEQKPLPEDARYNLLHELGVKQTQFQHALLQALGLSVTATAGVDSQTVIPGQTFSVTVHLADQGKDRVAVQGLQLATEPDHDWTLKPVGAAPAFLAGGTAQDVAFNVTVAQGATITKPYFTRPSLEQPYYDIANPEYQNRSWMPYPLAARAIFRYHNAEIPLNMVVQAVHRITGIGPVADPLMTAPAISVFVSPAAGIVPLTSKSFHISVVVRSNVPGPASGTVALTLPAGWRSSPTQATFTARRNGDEQNIEFEVLPKNLSTQPYQISVAAEYAGHRYASGSVMVGYPGLRPYPYYRNATYKTTGVDVHLPAGLNVAYVSGTGDEVAGSLEDIGVHAVFLSASDLATGDLDRFDAIILGVRAYAVRPELKTDRARLLDYVYNGGTLIVQYNLNGLDASDGPYPLQLGGNPEKVVDETSRVVLLDPKFPALIWPNKITTRDFEGWVEERGHGFMRQWDPRYFALTETHDPGQAPQKGGLLVARYGKGFYVYEGYALYRQLPEGVPGAYRIFANLLSLSRNTGMEKLPVDGR
jgi:LmbE family N-acetylglucosaminyl deacetylase